MARFFEPPLAYMGVLARDAARVTHAYLRETEPAFCGLDPRPPQWKTHYVLTGRPIASRISEKPCKPCQRRLIEVAILRSLERMGGQGLFTQIVADIPGGQDLEKVLDRSLTDLVGTHEVTARIVPGKYPNLISYELSPRNDAGRLPSWNWGGRYNVKDILDEQADDSRG
ncbi:MAG TPA: hypothetical protein VM327_02925 [Candidatus Thermoplasmatota archaeon]|nr:hypothetical protein [Candidatus Thermoplasmatota archaeon]